MAFTAQELENIANSVIDFHERKQPYSQTIQMKPLYKDLTSEQKSFPAGKENLTWPVKGVYSSTIQGFTADDTVGYVNPANIKRAVTPWKELHLGINFTGTELKKEGIIIVDSLDGAQTKENRGRELAVLTNLLEDKLEDMQEGWERNFDSMLWDDGTADPKLIPGVRSFILDVPSAAGTTFGVDRVANTWWRNYADIGINAATPANQNLVTALQNGFRQQRRFGGMPNRIYAGSDFIEALEKELRALGNYTLDAFDKSIDLSVGDLKFKKIPVLYTPELDDRGEAKYGFMLDNRTIKLRYLEGDNKKRHAPARDPDKYVYYRATTYSGALTCTSLNSNGVYSIA